MNLYRTKLYTGLRNNQLKMLLKQNVIRTVKYETDKLVLNIFEFEYSLYVCYRVYAF